MNYNLLFDNNLTYGGIFLGCGLIFGFSLYYLIRSNHIATPSKNIETFTNEEIEAIFNENAVNVINNDENIDNFIIDSDSDTYFETESEESQTMYDSDSSSEYESVASDADSFIMPDVDFDVCPIEELKLFEFTSLYPEELRAHNISVEDIIEFLS
jgi:hypothetical protein